MDRFHQHPFMVLHLDDAYPLVWRTPTSVQVGIDAPHVVLVEVTAGVERLLAALRAGISVSGWEMLARDANVSPSDAQHVLDVLAPVMAAPAVAPPTRALVTGTGPLAYALAGLLQDAGALAPADDEHPALAVLVADWVIGPDDAARWLRDDVPHLPIVSADRSITVGPLVEPGAGPCIYCVHLAHTDDDPAWPAVSAQLWGRAAPRQSQLTVLSAATFAARVVLARLRDGAGPAPRGWRISADGAAISGWTARTHSRCSCAAPPESDWAPGPDRAVPAATRSSPVGGALG